MRATANDLALLYSMRQRRYAAQAMLDIFATDPALTPISFWVLDGKLGTAVDIVSGFDGTPNSIDTSRYTPAFDGANAMMFGGAGSGDYIQLPHTTLDAPFNPSAITLGLWFKPPNVGFWSEGLQPFLIEIGNGASNRIFIGRLTANGQIYASYRAGGVTDSAVVTGQTFTNYGLLVATADKATADKLIFYVNDVTPVESATLGVWTGALTATFCTISLPTATFEVYGAIPYAFLFDGAAAPETIAAIYALNNANGFPDVISPYTFLDQFITADAAPLTSPRNAEPGPGIWTAVQTDGTLAVSGGKLVFTAQSTPTWGDQGLYRTATYPRRVGRGGKWVVTPTVIATGTICFLGDATGVHYSDIVAGMALTLYNDTIVVSLASGAVISLGIAASVDTDYTFVIVERAAGAYLIAKGGVLTEWTLAYVFVAGTAAAAPAFSNYDGAGAVDEISIVELVDAIWAGEALATDQLSGTPAASTTFEHEADCTIVFVCTTLPTSAGSIRLFFRVQDATNYWELRILNTGAAELNEVVAGTPTTRDTAGAGTITNGMVIKIRCYNELIHCYKDDAEFLTYTSAASFKTETDGEISTLDASAVITNVRTYPFTLPAVAIAELDIV